MLADELGIEPRASDDSMTIVARGAALYAATQKLPSTARRRTPGEVARLELLLEYEAMTTNPRPLIVGKVDPGLVPAGSVVTIATDGDDTPTPAPVRADGTFHVEVALVPGGANRLHVRVMGPRGDHLPAEPVTLTIVHGVSMARPPLSQSVGVMLADNTVCVYLAKGTVLPARRTLIHVTTRTIRRGQSGEAISVPLIQGESGKGDRNKVIGVLRIFAFNLKRDLPSGTEVAVTLTIDEFSQTQARAYVPMLDQSFDEVVSFDLETKTAGVVHEHLEAQRARLAALEAVSLDGADEAAVDPRVQEVEALLDEGDRDSVDLADHLLRALAEELDDMDGAHAKKSLRTELEGGLARTEDLVTKLGKAEDITLLRALSGEVRHALTRGEFDLAKTRYNEAEQLHLMVLMRHHEFWHNLFERFSAHITAYGLEEAARTPLASGRRAIADRSTSQLVEACRELQKLLPRHIQDQQQALGMRLMSHIR